MYIFVGGRNGTRISVGRGCTTEGIQIIARGRRELVIGADCMFASDVLIRLPDSHLIEMRSPGR